MKAASGMIMRKMQSDYKVIKITIECIHKSPRLV